MALITCQNLSLGYDGREIVHDLNFAVHAGEYLCIVGENGSGKSTLMRTILGLQAPLGGSVLTGDGLSRTEIGYLPQQTVVQRDFPATVWEIVLSGCQGRRGYHPFYSGADKERARENIRKMGLAPLAKRCYRELSALRHAESAVIGRTCRRTGPESDGGDVRLNPDAEPLGRHYHPDDLP